MKREKKEIFKKCGTNLDAYVNVDEGMKKTCQICSCVPLLKNQQNSVICYQVDGTGGHINEKY